jgi:DNA-binding beta-propeller fold protein YncE
VIATIAFAPGEIPMLPVVDPHTGDIYVVGHIDDGDGYYNTAIWHIDPDTLTVTTKQVLHDAWLHTIAPDMAHDTIYFSGGGIAHDSSTAYIASYNVASDELHINAYPQYYLRNLVFDPATGLIYAAGHHLYVPGVFIFDPESPATLTDTHTLTDPLSYGLAFDPESHILYVATNNGLQAFDTTTWQLRYIHDFDPGVMPYDVKLGHICDQWV